MAPAGQLTYIQPGGRLLNLLLLFGFQHLSHHQLDGAQRQSCILLSWHFFFSLLFVAKLAVVKAAQLLLAPDLAGRQHVEHDFFFVSRREVGFFLALEESTEEAARLLLKPVDKLDDESRWGLY